MDSELTENNFSAWASSSQPVGAQVLVLGWQEVWPGMQSSQRLSLRRPWARIWAVVIFKIFNHRYGTDIQQPAQNASPEQ